MKKVLSLFLFITIALVGCAEKGNDALVLIQTKYGNIKLRLYDKTPAHRDNFLKIIDEGTLNKTLFHRVIKDFMIQGGDPDSKNALHGEMLGEGDLGYSLPAEFNFPEYYHKKGALAAAREPDTVNPDKRSSSCQFYIVQGKTYTDGDLIKMENRTKDNQRRAIFSKLLEQYEDSLNTLQNSGNEQQLLALQQKIMTEVSEIYEQHPFAFPDDVKENYKTIGGTPFLDGNYTVFGEVVESKNLWEKMQSLFGKRFGLEVVDMIANVETDKNDRPLEDIIMKVKVLKR